MSLDVYLIPDKDDENCVELWHGNLTHNLVPMAKEAGLFQCLWQPHEIGSKAVDMVPHIQAGLARLSESPEYFKMFNPKNGWGTYDCLVEVAEAYLSNCQMYPEADVAAYG